MNGGIYRHDPPPVQGRRFVPIPTPGDEPPRRTNALVMALVLASWPTGLEYQPQQTRPSAATLPQPEPQAAPPKSQSTSLSVILPSWAPASPQPQAPTRYVVPLTLTYGDEPPRRSYAGLYALLETWRPPPPEPWQLPRKIAPLTLTYGDTPPPRPIALAMALRQAWDAADQGRQGVTRIVQGAAVEGPQPRSLATLFSVVLPSWEPVPPQPQRLFPSAATLPVPAVDDPPPRSRAGLLSLILSTWEQVRQYFPSIRSVPERLAVHYELCLAVQSTLQGFAFAGIPSSQIYLRKFPTDRGGITLPAIVVSHPGVETVLPGTNERDDWGYPVVVSLISTGNQSLTVSNTELLWREQVRKLFHYKRLSTPAVNYVCEVEPGPIVDLSLFHDENRSEERRVGK